MIDWLYPMVPLLKALHIGALCLWAGGLVALPLMLARHEPAISQSDYQRVRVATHLMYTLCVTPAAVVTVIAGTWLVFLRETFVLWFYVKLVFVALLVSAHAWIGHRLVEVAEKPGRHHPPEPHLPLVLVLILIVTILVLVLAKPELGWVGFPEWLREPREHQFPFEVPRW